MGRKVVVTDHVFADLEPERSILERHGCELELAESTDEDALVAAVGGAEALLVCFAKVGERVVDAAGGLGGGADLDYATGEDGARNLEILEQMLD
jgi:hypothetical protein